MPVGATEHDNLHGKINRLYSQVVAIEESVACRNIIVSHSRFPILNERRDGNHQSPNLRI